MRMHLLFAIVLAAALPSVALADEDHRHEADHYADYQRDYVFGSPPEPTVQWTLASGGRLYDNWWEALGREEPTDTNPAYPARAAQSGATTWRCKECHGWDYKGRDGAYASGSHATGIVGIDRLRGADPAQVVRVLRGSSHGYTADMLPDDAAMSLARFVTDGQHDADAVIDQAGELKAGDVRRGQPIYQNVCAACHGFDGRALNFGSNAEP